MYNWKRRRSKISSSRSIDRRTMRSFKTLKYLRLNGLFKIVERVVKKSVYTRRYFSNERHVFSLQDTHIGRVGRQFRYIGRFHMSGEQEMQVEDIDRVPPEASATCNVSWCTRLCEYRCSASRTRTVYLDHSSLQFCAYEKRREER